MQVVSGSSPGGCRPGYGLGEGGSGGNHVAYILEGDVRYAPILWNYEKVVFLQLVLNSRPE